MSKKKKPAKPAGTYPKGINLPLRQKDYDDLKALAARLTEQRGTTVHQTDLLREGLQVVLAKYNKKP
jgi:hypothetical protein